MTAKPTIEAPTPPIAAPPLPLETTAIVRTRLTRAEAEEKYGKQRGMVWDEEEQAWIPLGQAVVQDQLARPMDLERELERFDKNRKILLQFIARYLEEAKYDDRGYPIAGQLNDYYKVPGAAAEQKALTKRGGSKLAQLFRWARGTPELVQQDISKDGVSVTVKVPLWTHLSTPAGAGLSACSTAEAGFRTIGARKKYGARFNDQKKEIEPPDYRAALNDVVARAGKRAFVQAVIVSAAAEEIFSVAVEDEPPPAPGGKPEDREPPPPKESEGGARLPKSKFGAHGGKLISEVPADALVRIAQWMRKEAKHPEAWAPLAGAIDLELDQRLRDTLDGEDDDLPF